MLVLSCWRTVSPLPNFKAGGSSFVVCPHLFIQHIYNHTGCPLHLQPENMPCFGKRLTYQEPKCYCPYEFLTCGMSILLFSIMDTKLSPTFLFILSVALICEGKFLRSIPKLDMCRYQRHTWGKLSDGQLSSVSKKYVSIWLGLNPFT